MGLRAALRFGLVLLAVFGLAAIVWSLSNRSGGGSAPSAELLDPGIARQSTDFEHAEFKLGKVLFRVQSTIDTLTDIGQHELRNVRLTVFDEDGEPTDEISGEKATYALEEKRIEFSGGVEARLADGTRILSDRLHADLAAETVSIQDRFRFDRGQVRGSGRGMLYRISSKSIEINHDFLLENPVSPGAFQATASLALYDLAGARISLTGNAVLTGPGYRLSGNGMVVDLTDERRVRRIIDTGGARFVVSEKVFEGQRMEFAFEPASARLREFAVMGGEESPKSLALYTESRPGGVHRLLARRITAVPSAGSSEPDRFQLETLRAEREVRLDSSALGIEEATATTLDGTFDGQGGLRLLKMAGGVSVQRLEGERMDRLRGESLQIQFDQAQRMKRAVVSPNAVFTMTSPGLTRRHSAKDAMVVDFVKGLVSQIDSSGGCEVKTSEASGESSVQSASMHADYTAGMIDRVVASGGVRVLLADGAKTQRTESRDLRLLYQQGRLHRAVQSGGFHFVERNSSYELDLRAAEAVFSPDRNLVTAQGGASRPELRQKALEEAGAGMASRTIADRFEIERASGRVVAAGKVATHLENEGRPVRIVAEKMRADPSTGLVEYTGSPRVTEGSSFISGKTVRLQDREQNLVAEGDVESFLSSGVGDKLKEYRVSADKVEIERAANKAVYEGKVRANSEQLTVRSPFLELLFAGAGMEELELATAWGGVEVEDDSRRATGEKAFFEPLEKKVKVVGEKAQVVDSRQGKATGKVLTFFLGDERILIEGPINPKP